MSERRRTLDRPLINLSFLLRVCTASPPEKQKKSHCRRRDIFRVLTSIPTSWIPWLSSESQSHGVRQVDKLLAESDGRYSASGSFAGQSCAWAPPLCGVKIVAGMLLTQVKAGFWRRFSKEMKICRHRRRCAVSSRKIVTSACKGQRTELAFAGGTWPACRTTAGLLLLLVAVMDCCWWPSL